MATPLDLEIRSRIAAVLAGELALRDFYYWFGPATWNVRAAENPEAARLTYALAHLFAELDIGDYPPGELKRDLRRMASTYVSTSAPWNRPKGPGVRTTDFNEIIEAPTLRLVLGRRRAAAPA